MTAFKKLSLISSTFLVFYFGEIAVNIACGPEPDPYDYYVTYFHNNVQGEDYTPFAFNALVALYSEEDVEKEADVNSKDWAKHLGVDERDVVKVMYKIDSATSVKMSQYDGNTAQLPDSLQRNTFLQALGKQRSVLQYYLFAKSCEPFASVAYDLWNPEPRDTVAMALKGEEALKLASGAKNDFLKLRYAYQAARMFHYAGDYTQCKTTYEQFIQNAKGDSPVKGWALALYAGATRKTGEPELAAYLFSKVFASNAERRIQAYKNYYYTSTPVNGALQHAKDDAEKANIWAINGFGNADFDLNSLNQVYKLAPKSMLNGALLVREVNKLEQALIKDSDIAKISFNYYFSENENSTFYQDSIKTVNLKHLNAIKTFALKLASDKKYPQPVLGYITAAYLSWMEGKPIQGVAYLSNIKNTDKLPTRLKDQARIIHLLCEATKIKKGGQFNEDDLLASLKWLDEKRYTENLTHTKDNYYEWGNANRRFTVTARNFYQQILAPAYMNMGDTAKAALAMVKGDLNTVKPEPSSLFKNMSYQTTTYWQHYLSPQSMKELNNYKIKSNKDDVIGLLAKTLNQLANDDFYELYGTTFLRTHQYEKAVEMFNKVSSNYQYASPQNWYASEEHAKLYANPFIETIKDYPKNYASSKTATTKKTFATQMLRLQKLILSDKKNAASYYYKMANAVYQTGYYGNSWFLISYDWSSYDNYIKPRYGYDADYKRAQTAKSWYLKARSLSTNADFKAKCTFMLAKCTQKQIILDAYPLSFFWYDKEDKKYKDFLTANYNNPYFKELKSKYKQTSFYKKAVGECSYLADFISDKMVKGIN